MLHNKQKVISGILIIIVVTIVMLGYSSSHSFVSAFPLQSANHHHKVFDKKQDSGSSSRDMDSGSSDNNDRSSSSSQYGSSDVSSSSSGSSTDTKNSYNSNSIGNNSNNNDQGANGGSNTGADNNLHAIESPKTDQQQQGTGENIPPTETTTPTPQTTCEQGSDCTDQQGSGNSDHSTTPTTTKQDNTPFVFSLPFP
jgi:clumping factor A